MHQFREAGIGHGLRLSFDVRGELGVLCRVWLGGACVRVVRRGVVWLGVGLRSGCGVRLGLRCFRSLRRGEAAFGAVGIGAFRLDVVRLDVGLRSGSCLRLWFGSFGVSRLGAVRLDRVSFGLGFALPFGGGLFGRVENVIGEKLDRIRHEEPR